MRGYHYQTKKEQYKQNRALLCHCMGVDETFFFTLILEAGIEFIEEQTENYPDVRNQILYTPGLFWPWWTNQWNLRDQDFIYENALDDLEGQDIAQEFSRSLFRTYLQTQQQEISSNEIMSKGYDSMLQKMIAHA
jgi:hypothetical protein